MKKLILSLATVLALAGTAKATVVTLGTYDFANNNGTVSNPNSGVSFSTIAGYTSSGGSAPITISGNQMSIASWKSGQYLAYTISPVANSSATLGSLSFSGSYAGNQNASITKIEIWRSGTMIASTATAGSITLSGSSTLIAAAHTLNYSVTSPVSISSDVQVRIFASVDSGNGTAILDDFKSSGDMTAVPEPVNVALILFGCTFAGVGIGRKFLKKKAA